MIHSYTGGFTGWFAVLMVVVAFAATVGFFWWLSRRP